MASISHRSSCVVELRALLARRCTPSVVVALAMCVIASVTAQGAEGEDTLQVEVEAFQKSFKAAYDARDQARVLQHFQHGSLLPPLSDRVYRNMGREPFWEKPIRSVKPNADGSIEAEFVLDPESARPAQFMTLSFVRGPQGGLLIERGRQERQPTTGAKADEGAPQAAAAAKRTIAYMRTFVTVLEIHRLERGAYPTGNIDELPRLFESLNMGKVESADAWGTPFRYVADEAGTSYTLASAGADKTFRPETWNPESRDSSDPAEDIVVRDADFVKMWKEPK